MTAADIRNAIGHTDIILADLACSRGKLSALRTLIKGIVAKSSEYVLDEAEKDIESAQFRQRIVRDRLVHEASLLGAYGTEVAR